MREKYSRGPDLVVERGFNAGIPEGDDSTPEILLASPKRLKTQAKIVGKKSEVRIEAYLVRQKPIL